MFNETCCELIICVGLDTADPLYDDKLENNLDKGDAQFVDIIHTNAGHLGKQVALGHVDFYVNGGSKQLNCDNVKSKIKNLNLFSSNIKIP